MKENLILYEFRRYFESYMLKAFLSFEKLNVMSKDELFIRLDSINFEMQKQTNAGYVLK